MGSGNFQRRVWSTGPTRHAADDHNKSTVTQGSATDTLAPLLWLVVTFPLVHRGKILPVPANSIFGRNGDVRWEDDLVSRQHARFVLTQATPDAPQLHFAILPQQDRNGTFVNGQRISNVTLLRENDRIEMGDTQFVVKVLY